jgi:hypothetical protein
MVATAALVIALGGTGYAAVAIDGATIKTAMGGLTATSIIKPTGTSGQYCFSGLAARVVTATASVGDVASVSSDPSVVAANCPGVSSPAPVFVVVTSKLAGGTRENSDFAVHIDY